MRRKGGRKKKIWGILLSCFMFFMTPVFVWASETKIETELTLHYTGGENRFYFYKIAEFHEPDQYILEQPFLEYEGKVTGLDRLNELSTEERRLLASTFDNVVVTDKIRPDNVISTDEEGMLVWPDIPLGLYLITGEKVIKETEIITSVPVLLSVPLEGVGNEWEYHVEILHNKVEIEDAGRMKEIPVLMIWEDEGAEEHRPEEVNVMLYEGPEVYDDEPFAMENNWSYTWEKLPPEKDWKIKEEELPEGYTYTYTRERSCILIINTYKRENPPVPDESLPQTGQLWWPVPLLALSGTSVYVIGWAGNRFSDKKSIEL